MVYGGTAYIDPFKTAKPIRLPITLKGGSFVPFILRANPYPKGNRAYKHLC